jgi:hypothetical protein
MKKIAISVITVLLTIISNGQDLQLEYSSRIKNADSLYKIKEYKKSAIEYSRAFETMGWKGKLLDRYNAACSWALASVSDSAFFQLYKIATFDQFPYKNYDHITTDKDLLSLHNDKRWQPLLEMIRKNKEKAVDGSVPKQ